jgi:hypothetical protein
MERLKIENDACEQELSKLKAYAVAITQEIVEMVAMLEKTKGEVLSCRIQ